jgi:alpha/beta superfamily hydrolase
MGLQDAFMTEKAVVLGQRKSLVGIVTELPATTINRRLGIILLNPGLVHRVGPSRIYVKIARALAAKGFVVLRFDFSGIGDSAVRQDHLPFEKSAISEAREAMNFLRTTRDIDHFILLGGCSGAVVALETAGCDPRVQHTVLINYPVVSDEEPEASPQRLSRAKSHYYWNFALFNPRSWGKLLTGKADYRHIFSVLGSQVRRRLAPPSKPQASETRFAHELRQVAARGVSLTFVCSQGDPALDDLREAGRDVLKRLCELDAVSLEIIPRSDHTFSSLHDQERLVKVIVDRIEAVSSEKVKAIEGSQFALQAQEVNYPNLAPYQR